MRLDFQQFIDIFVNNDEDEDEGEGEAREDGDEDEEEQQEEDRARRKRKKSKKEEETVRIPGIKSKSKLKRERLKVSKLKREQTKFVQKQESEQQKKGEKGAINQEVPQNTNDQQEEEDQYEGIPKLQNDNSRGMNICMAFVVIIIFGLLYFKSKGDSFLQTERFRSEVRQDYYSVLGIDQSSTEADIKRAVKRMTVRYHPDKVKGCDDLCRENYELIRKAGEVLGSKQSRQDYDNNFGNVPKLPSKAKSLSKQFFWDQMHYSRKFWLIQVFDETNQLSAWAHHSFQSVLERYKESISFGRISMWRHKDAGRYLPYNVHHLPAFFTFYRGRTQLCEITFERGQLLKHLKNCIEALLPEKKKNLQQAQYVLEVRADLDKVPLTMLLLEDRFDSLVVNITKPVKNQPQNVRLLRLDNGQLKLQQKLKVTLKSQQDFALLQNKVTALLKERTPSRQNYDQLCNDEDQDQLVLCLFSNSSVPLTLRQSYSHNNFKRVRQFNLSSAYQLDVVDGQILAVVGNRFTVVRNQSLDDLLAGTVPVDQQLRDGFRLGWPSEVSSAQSFTRQLKMSWFYLFAVGAGLFCLRQFPGTALKGKAFCFLAIAYGLSGIIF